ncbi:MAG: RagB/SusD family nutrient uptake outer membrane protein [Chitinophagaceae bacterium]
MKVLNKITWMALVSCMLVSVGCQKVLDEKNRSGLARDYFTSPGGIDAAVIATYSNLRNWYCQEGMCYNTMIGTDENIPGFGTSGNFHTYTLQANDGGINSIWEWSYRSINNANGVLQYADAAGLTTAQATQLKAEAKFMRAYYYFMLVITFGDVSISTQFASSPSTSATREPIATVYDLIVKDLTEALVDLPAKPTSPGRAGKAATLHLLSKVYLTRGWSTAAKATDFTDAYTTANSLITNKATYGIDLWSDYADMWKEANDYSNKEVIFQIERNTDPKGSETTGIGTGNPGGKFNGANFYQRPNYPIFSVNLNGGITGAPAFTLNGTATATTNPVDRDVAYGRPFGRVRPSNYVLNTAFADKTNDTRYAKTFQLIYMFNRPGPLAAQTPVTIVVTRAASPGNPAGPLAQYTWQKGVDTAIILTGKATVTEDERKVTKSYLMTTNQYDVNMFPSNKKHDDVTRAHTNDASDRPFPLMRFAETYLIAAEAAFKGGSSLTNAANMINVVRNRAGALPITSADVTLDFILDERTRELFGEWMRWYDLVRTKTLQARLATYNPIPAFRADRDYLRPIPLQQINLVTTGPKYPQNPNY